MKTLSVVFLASVVFIFVMFTSCEDQPIYPKELSFSGLPHTATGSAGLELNSSNYLDVINTGSENENFGVQIDIPVGQSMDMFFEQVNLPENGEISILNINPLSNTTENGITITRNGQQGIISAYGNHSKPVTAKAYLNGELVFSKDYETGETRRPIFTLSLVIGNWDAHVSKDDTTGWDAGVSWNNKAKNGITYGTGTTVVGQFEGESQIITTDYIEVSVAADEDDQNLTTYQAEIQASGLEDFVIKNEVTYTPIHDVVTPWLWHLGSKISDGTCVGCIGFCDITWPFPSTISNDLINAVVVKDGYLQGDELFIEIDRSSVSDVCINEITAGNIFYNPQPFVLPQQFVEEVYAKANRTAPELIELPIGEYAVYPELTTSGDIRCLIGPICFPFFPPHLVCIWIEIK